MHTSLLLFLLIGFRISHCIFINKNFILITCNMVICILIWLGNRYFVFVNQFNLCLHLYFFPSIQAIAIVCIQTWIDWNFVRISYFGVVKFSLEIIKVIREKSSSSSTLSKRTRHWNTLRWSLAKVCWVLLSWWPQKSLFFISSRDLHSHADFHVLIILNETILHFQ